MKSLELPFSLRDLVCTPRHVHLACDPIPPPKTKKKATKPRRTRSTQCVAFVWLMLNGASTDETLALR